MGKSLNYTVLLSVANIVYKRGPKRDTNLESYPYPLEPRDMGLVRLRGQEYGDYGLDLGVRA